MREIKFRVWDVKGKVIHYAREDIAIGLDGSLFRMDYDVVTNMTQFENLDNEYIPMQYTGLKDKEDKEIYEGDIVLASFTDKVDGLISNVKGKITCNTPYGFMIETKYFNPLDPEKLPWFFTFQDVADCQCGGKRCVEMEIEVIGNIYENPELIGE